MNDILKTYKEQFRENRHTLRRYTAFVLALAMITTLFVNWQLHGVGISMTAQYQCGEVEHAHTVDCYDKVLICGYTEGELENADEVAAAEAAAASAAQSSAEEEIMPLELEPQIEFVPHEHTDDCYTEVQTLTCLEEEHVHDDDCYDPEDGSLICEKFEHTHDESCYTTEYELTCGLEEGELVEQVVEPTQTAELVAMAVAEPVALEPVVDTVEPIYHHHTDACYEEVLVCPLPEHHHTVSCLSDTSADLETPEEWQAANAEAVITGEWNEDLLSVAKTQLGYEQSEKNFEIDPADGVTLRYYSRYGQSYGNAYGEWDVMFLAYCLKYAEIPQSAIPQEASVLALRSSMSGMDWLLEEDGSAAQPGDIVIYNKYVTRTVAVDSSAAGAEPDLDDLFSMDAEFENSAELEDTGVSALDAAPSADDSTGAQDTAATSGTQDTVLTPEPVDPQTEQPAEKPVDSADTAAPSTVTSVSGADTLAPSVVSPAAEPQTTTVTDALPVETVGIVSSVDEDADTLTVISGDVDGKVAEVTLFNTEVENVISVAYAQIELSEGDSDSDDDISSDIIETDPVFSCSVTTVYETASSSAVRPSRSRAARYAAPSTYAAAAVSATAVDMGTHITNVSVQVPAYTDGSGNVTSWKDANGIVRPGQTVKVQLNYGFAANEITSDNRVATYKLPNGITLLPSVSHSGNITWHDSTTGKNVIVGTYAIDGDTVTFTYNEEFADGKAFDGDFEFKASVSSDSSMENQEINFGGTTGSVTIKKEDLTHDLSLSKNVQKDEAGKELIKFDPATKTLDIAYEVVAKTTNGTGTTVDITDFFDTASASLGNFQENTIQLIKVAADGSETDVTETYKSQLNVNGSELKYTALPELKAGEQYVLRYHATIQVHDDYTYQSINKVKAEFDGKDSSTSKEVKNTEPRLTKSGNYDANSRIITWTVTIKNPYGEDLRGKKFTDLLPAELEVVNNVEITRGYYSNDLGPISAEDFKKAGCSYTFPTDKSETAAFYTIKIQTKVPDGTAVGTTYSNTAEFDGNSAFGEVTVTDRSSYLSKSLSTAEDLETGKKKLTWQTSVSIPTGWNKITLTDTIHDAEVNGIEQDGTHYAVLSELRDEIKANLYLTLFNSSETVTMANASEHHVTFTVTYYDEHGNTITNNDAHVAQFTITAKLADGQTLDATSMVLSSYHTVADISNAGIEEPWLFVNNAASGDKTSDASYTYKKPKEAKLEKLVYEYGNFNSAGSKISELDYTSNGGKICYELTIPTSLTCKDPLTTEDLVITDILPVGVTFDKSNIIAVGALSFNTDGSVPHQGYISPTIYGSGGRSNYDISATTNFSVSKDHISATDTDRIITFTINHGYNVSAKPQVFYIRYWVSVAEDASWDDLRTENKYRNSAEWNGDKAETETTVKRSYEKLYKTGTVVTEDPDANGKPTATKKINYSVVINPTGAKLLTTSNTLTLTDTLSFNPSANTSADLDLSSIHLYGVTLDTTTGNLVADHTNEIGHDRFTATYDSPNHTMTVTVPDELACVLEYTYQISYPSSTEVTVKNAADLSGLEQKYVDTKVVNYDSSATVRFSKFDLNKVDSNDYLVTLPGATFQLAKWNSTKFEEVCTLKTNSSGQINFGLLDSSATAETTDTSSAQLLCSTLYRIVETDAPTGYALSKSPIYLLWGAFSNTKQDDAFKTATGETWVNDSEYNQGIDSSKVTYLARGDISAVYVPNTANSITVAKHWLDTDGKTELALDKVNSTYTATVELWRKGYKGGSQTSDTKVETVTLDSSNDWSHSWDSLSLTDPDDSSITYKYYVKETACSGTFKYDLNNTGITGGTILLYNQVPEDANYELPSTGGTGTLPYTAVGGTMMLSALAYSFIHRKRRREGRADD